MRDMAAGGPSVPEDLEATCPPPPTSPTTVPLLLESRAP